MCKPILLVVSVAISIGMLAACSGGEQTAKAVDVAPEIVETIAEPEIEETLDFGSADIEFEYVPEEGGFLWPCTGNDECDSAFCIVTKTGGKCTTQCVEDCPSGWECVEADTQPDLTYICIPRFLTLCDPCETNDNCQPEGADTAFLDLCLDYPDGSGKFCGADCSGDVESCPPGYICQTVTTPGGSFQQCMPEEGVCECSFFAIQQEKTTECSVENEFGTCLGHRICNEDGLSPCDAQVPAEESCDDIDNDCDDVVDEGCDDDEDGFCDSSMTTVGTPSSCGNGGGDCDDGEPTVFPGATEKCDKKDNDCDGIIDNGLCEDGNPCTDDLCDPEEGCSHPLNEALCDDGNSCTDNDHCFEGSCQGAEKVCDDGNLCTSDLCNPVSELGCYFVNNSDACDDDGNPCTTDVCENGACQHKLATDLPCDDSNPCTEGDLCKSGTCVSGGPKNCDDDEQCTSDSCDQQQGCIYEVMQGTPCIYSLLICDIQGTCGSNGCVPQPNCVCPNCTICVCCGIIQLCLDDIFGGG